jgi:hydroxymethylpyrimidine/phosphomethylpyrimidine kinase
MIMPKSPPKVMTFSATDPTGGAGLQADILTLASLGCHPLSITTAITVQDTIGVESLMAIDADWVNDQARSILEDVEVSVFKLGLLGSTENIAMVAEIVADYPNIPLVLDPILASGRGDELVNAEMMDAMIQLLFPQASLVTPNSFEARRLVVKDEEEFSDISINKCARRLKDMGCQNVLITGTHEKTDVVVNTFYAADGETLPFYWERLSGGYHGSGCTLASAISAYYAQGFALEVAIEEGQYFTWKTLKNAFKAGMGQAIPDRFFWINEDDNDGRCTHH